MSEKPTPPTGKQIELALRLRRMLNGCMPVLHQEGEPCERCQDEIARIFEEARRAASAPVAEPCNLISRDGDTFAPASAVPPDLPIPGLTDLMNAGRWQDATMLLIRKVDALYRRSAPSVSGEGERQDDIIADLKSIEFSIEQLIAQAGRNIAGDSPRGGALKSFARYVVDECHDALGVVRSAQSALSSASSGDAGTGAEAFGECDCAEGQEGDGHDPRCASRRPAASPKAGPA